ncbi:MAG TPA: glycosyl hydrolase family 28 protein [Verrucomicrobiae bacterium]|jgi:polygalacturonase
MDMSFSRSLYRYRIACVTFAWFLSLWIAQGEIETVEPHIPAHQFSLTQFGAVGDGKTFDTDAFSNAVAAIKQAGGGTLVVPAGIFLTAPFQVTDNMELKLEKGAYIKASDRLSDYGYPENLPLTQKALNALHIRTLSLIHGTKLETFVLSGEGTIDGNGPVWWQHVNKPTYYKKGNLLFNARPYLVQISDCKNFVVRGITLINSPAFHIVPVHCEHVLIENVHIISPQHAPNTDGIDPSGCKNVLIRHCDIDCGDDDVAIKAGGVGLCENIEIADCLIKHQYGITIGSETYGGCRHMLVTNCVFEGTKTAIAIRSAADRGGEVTDIRYENLTMHNVGLAIEFTMLYGANNASWAKYGGDPRVPYFHGVVVRNIQVTGASQAMNMQGLAESPIADFNFENVKIDANTGMVIENAKGIVFKNVQVTAKKGNSLTTKNAEITRE